MIRNILPNKQKFNKQCLINIMLYKYIKVYIIYKYFYTDYDFVEEWL